MTTTYNPAARHEIKVWDIEFRRNPKRTLMARIFQPQGAGPFPVLLDLHGGAWSRKDRYANEPMARAIDSAERKLKALGPAGAAYLPEIAVLRGRLAGTSPGS